MRLIDADALNEALGVGKECADCQYSVGGGFCIGGDLGFACEAIADAPTVEPQLIEEINKLLDPDIDSEIAVERIRDIVYRSVQPVEPQHIKGRWERKESDLSWWYECSECGESPLFDPYENEVLTRFCPWCGAEMRGDDDATD